MKTAVRPIKITRKYWINRGMRYSLINVITAPPMAIMAGYDFPGWALPPTQEFSLL
jgi:hypothetical protein